MSKITHATLLKIFLVYETYKQYAKYVRTDWLTHEARQIFVDLEEYYAKTPKNIDLDKFSVWFHQFKHPEIHESKRSEYNAIFANLADANVAPLEDVLQSFRAEATKDRLRKALDGKLNADEIKSIISLHEEAQGVIIDETPGESSMDLETFHAFGDRSKGLKFRLDCLNQGLGGLVQGDLIIVAAFVDGGKTAFTISELTYMATQIDSGCVAWFNNEEPDNRVKLKIYSSVLGAPIPKVRENWQAAKKSYLKKLGGDLNRIRFFDCRGKGVSYIAGVCEKYRPKLIIIDQADKLAGGSTKDGADHSRIKKLYGDIRGKVAIYGPTIAVSQCDATTRWKDKETMQVQYQRVIDQTQLDGSKVGKPGEADAIITIGQDVRFPASRYISICKNKMDGINELYRAIKGYEVTFDGSICRYKDPIGDPNANPE